LKIHWSMPQSRSFSGALGIGCATNIASRSASQSFKRIHRGLLAGIAGLGQQVGECHRRARQGVAGKRSASR
jgi:hypothetical protein